MGLSAQGPTKIRTAWRSAIAERTLTEAARFDGRSCAVHHSMRRKHNWRTRAPRAESGRALGAHPGNIRQSHHAKGGKTLPRNRNLLAGQEGAIASAVAIALVMAGTLWLLAAQGVLDSTNASDWFTAIFTGGLVIVAGAALLPAASQVRQAAKASAESHRPYVTVMTRPAIGGFLYLDLVNNVNRAALEVTADLSSPPLVNVTNMAKPTAPFGTVSYLAPNERRSVFYSGGDATEWPPELVVEVAYTGEDGKKHSATVTHDMEALRLILVNPENKKTPQALLDEGLKRIEGIVSRAVAQATGRQGGI